MFQPQLGLKGSSDRSQMDDRLQHQPAVYEFYTNAHDFTKDGYHHLYDAVQYIQSHGIQQIVIHHPMNYQGHHLDVVAPEKSYPQLYHFIETSTEQLIRLADDLNVQVLVHGGYAGPEVQHMVDLYPSADAARHAVYQRLDRFQKAGGNHIMFENSIAPVFAYGDSEQEEQILSHHYRLAFDTSHCFIELHGDNHGLAQSLRHLGPSVVHYHLVDSMGQTHDSLPLGQGKIDWPRVLPLLNSAATSIYEIALKDPNDCHEQLISHHYLMNVYSNLINQDY